MIRDSFGRLHNYLRISLTDRCNFGCTYCLPAPYAEYAPAGKIMTAEEVVDLAQVFVSMGVVKIRLTGGEPLVRKNAKEIIHGLGSLNSELTITTNGFLADHFIHPFHEAGIRTINVSLDSLDEKKFESICGVSAFRKVRNNIDLLLREGFKVKINTVVMKDLNEDELLSFAAWTCFENIHIRFIEFMPFKGNKWDLSRTVGHTQILKKITDKYEIEKLSDTPHSTSKAYKIPGAMGTFAIISTVTSPFCGDCNRMRLTADGKLKNCLFATKEADLLTPFRQGKDVREIILTEISRKKEFLGGIQAFQNDETAAHSLQNRAMISIGG
jgi:cyclic pyranopterin phosphate synthase